MREKYKPKLQEDFNKYAKQIGIMDNEMPRLVTNRKEIDELKQTFKDKGRGRSTVRNYGICYTEERIVYVNINSRKIRKKIYSHVKYTPRHRTAHKATYRDYLHTLIHELVHYRWHYLQHGAEYEKRIREILLGKVFPEKRLYNDTTPEINNNITEPRPVYESNKDKLQRLHKQIRII